MIPLSDDNPRQSPAYITLFLLALMSFVFALEFYFDSRGQIDAFIAAFGLVPDRLDGPSYQLVTYIFLHAGWLHILPNLLFLWIFADNVEDALGPLRFLGFFLICGILSGLVHLSLLNFEGQAPLIGASGAISAILGAYFALFRFIRLKVLFPTLFLAPPLLLFGAPYFWRFYMPASVFLLIWFGNDLIQALTSQASSADIAFWTHISGFIIGAGLALIMRRKDYDLRRHRDSRYDYKTLIFSGEISSHQVSKVTSDPLPHKPSDRPSH